MKNSEKFVLCKVYGGQKDKLNFDEIKTRIENSLFHNRKLITVEIVP